MINGVICHKYKNFSVSKTRRFPDQWRPKSSDEEHHLKNKVVIRVDFGGLKADDRVIGPPGGEDGVCIGQMLYEYLATEQLDGVDFIDLPNRHAWIGCGENCLLNWEETNLHQIAAFGAGHDRDRTHDIRMLRLKNFCRRDSIERRGDRFHRFSHKKPPFELGFLLINSP